VTRRFYYEKLEFARKKTRYVTGH